MGWWFGRKGAPEQARPLVPAWLRPADEQGFARSYETQFDEVYRQNPVGQRAVRLVAGLAGALPIHSVEGDTRAAELAGTDGLIEAIAANLLLHGNAFAQLVAGSDDGPAEICLLRPERVSVVTNERGWPVAYLYRAGGRTIRIERADGLGRRNIAHIRSLHPRDDHYGMGCLEAATAAASVHNRASRWNKALLDNAARPSGALVHEPKDGADLSAEQFARRSDRRAASQRPASISGDRQLLHRRK